MIDMDKLAKALAERGKCVVEINADGTSRILEVDEYVLKPKKIETLPRDYTDLQLQEFITRQMEDAWKLPPDRLDTMLRSISALAPETMIDVNHASETVTVMSKNPFK